MNFHDLRREAGSRFLDAKMHSHYVQGFLDHATLSTTSRYLKGAMQGMHDALKQVEPFRSRCNSVENADDQQESTEEALTENVLQ